MILQQPACLFVASLVKDRVDVEGQSRDQSLLGGGCVLGEFHVQDDRVREHFREGGLGALEDDAQVGILARGFGVVGRVNPVGGLAAAPSAGISLGAAVDAASPAAGGRIDQIEVVSVPVQDLHGGDAIPAGFVDASEACTSAGHGGLLVRAALAAGKAALEGPFHGDDFRVGGLFLDDRLVGMDGSTAHAAETTRVLQGLKDLFVSLEVLELGQGLTAETLLDATPASLSHDELFHARKVGFHGTRAAIVHYISLHDYFVIVWVN